MNDAWESGDAYEPFIGRWSRLVAPAFLSWLGVAPGARWVDVGCGTGALTSAILRDASPASVVGVEPSEAFLAYAAGHVAGATFLPGSADAIPLPDGSVDAVAAGLVLNFVPDPAAAVAESRRVLAPGGVAGAYVWDYAGGMEPLRHFWDVAGRPDLDEGNRFPLCHADALAAAFATFDDVEVRLLAVEAAYADFDDYWTPFLGGVGPAPAYVATLDDGGKAALRDALRRRVTVAADGSVPMRATAWAVRGLT